VATAVVPTAEAGRARLSFVTQAAFEPRCVDASGDGEKPDDRSEPHEQRITVHTEVGAYEAITVARDPDSKFALRRRVPKREICAPSLDPRAIDLR
jgi:hypothetical protein